MTASAPSNTAVATSEASARVGAGAGDHAFQHLGGDDDRDAAGAGGADDAFLGEGDLLRGKLDAQVAAGDHDGVGQGEDGVEVVEGLGLLDLAHDPGAAGGDRAGLGHVLRTLDEAEADEVDPVVEGEAEVGVVLVREGGDGEDHVGDVDALAVGQGAADDHLGFQVVAAGVEDAEAELAVVEQEVGADGGGADDLRVGELDAGAVAGDGGQVQPEALAGLELDAAAAEAADAELRALDVGEDADRAAGLLLECADEGDAGAVVVVGAVAEVDAEDVGAGVEQAAQHVRGGGGGAEGGDDAGAAVTPEVGAAGLRLRWHGAEYGAARGGAPCEGLHDTGG